MTTKTKRDLHADLAICEAATPGTWLLHDAGLGKGHVYTSVAGVLEPTVWESQIADAAFIAEARVGWPHAIERVLTAEAELPAARMLLVDMRKRAVAAEKERDHLRAGIAAAMTYPPGIIRAKLSRILAEVGADE